MKWVGWVIGTLAVFVIGDCIGIVPLEPIARLAGGWIAFVLRVTRELHISPEGVLGAATCLIAVLVLGHAAASWWWRETGHDRRWKRRWTVAGIAGIVTMFAAGIAVTGAAHQVVWLAKSDGPIMRLSFRRSTQASLERTYCESNLKQIGAAIEQYRAAHGGQWPNELTALTDATHLAPETLDCPAGGRMYDRNGARPYVYYGHDWAGDAEPDVPVVSEPLAYHDGDGVNILFGDGHVEFVEARRARDVLAVRGPTARGTTHPLATP